MVQKVEIDETIVEMMNMPILNRFFLQAVRPCKDFEN